MKTVNREEEVCWSEKNLCYIPESVAVWHPEIDDYDFV